MTRALKYLLWILLVVTASGADAGAELIVEDAWIREAPGDAAVLAGYARITNPGSLPLTVVGAKAKLFKGAEIHETRIENGLSLMRPVANLPIAAGGTVELAPGAIHLMLMQPRYPMRKDDQADIVFVLSDGREIKVTFTVRRDG